MINKIVITFIILIICITGLNAQQIKRWNSNYKVGEVEYSKWQLPDVVSQDSFALMVIIKGFKQQKAANTSGLISLALITTGGILIATDQASDPFGNTLTGAFIWLLSPIPGIIGITFQINAIKNRKSGIRHYNEFYADLPLRQENINISINTTNNGIGLLVHF